MSAVRNRPRFAPRFAAALCLLALLAGAAGRWASRAPDEAGAERAQARALLLLSEPEGFEAAVEPLLPIERAWDIEDTRREAALPVLGMSGACGALGFDRESGTFFCPIGVREDWPELALSARGPEGMRVAWIDDYEADDPRGAASGCERYALLAWTEEEYAYFGLVFTGLPVVTVETADGAAPGGEDSAARFALAGGERPFSSGALVHRRGGGVRHPEKYSMHVELERVGAKGRLKKREAPLLGMEADSDWLLISGDQDATLLRNLMGWQLWRAWHPDGGVSLLEGRLCEVFVNGGYMGVYALQQRVRPQRELERLGSPDGTAVRLIKKENTGKRPRREVPGRLSMCMELRRKPERMTEEEAFRGMDDYVLLSAREQDLLYADDEAFLRAAERRTDLEDLMNFQLFLCACSMGYDNVNNNVYVWRVGRGEDYTYRLSPWDMDLTFEAHGSDEGGVNLLLPWSVRLLDMDYPGARAALHRIWREKRATILSPDAVERWIDGLSAQLTETGALTRENERWPERLDGTLGRYAEDDKYYLLDHLAELDAAFEARWPEGGGE